MDFQPSIYSMYECPLCGKDSNRKGHPLDRVDKVVGHINGSHDDDHAGVRGEELVEEIEATGGATPADRSPDHGDGTVSDGTGTVSEPPDSDRSSTPPDAGGGDGGAVAVTAVDSVEEGESEAPPDFEEDTDDEGIVAMPETELNNMLEAAASLKPDGSEDDEETSSSSSQKSETSSTSLDVDPVETVENADTEGWSVWTVLLLLGLAVVAGVVWGMLKDAAQNSREQANQFAHRHGPDLSGVSTV